MNTINIKTSREFQKIHSKIFIEIKNIKINKYIKMLCLIYG